MCTKYPLHQLPIIKKSIIKTLQLHILDIPGKDNRIREILGFSG